MAAAQTDAFGNPLDPNDPFSARNALTDQMGMQTNPFSPTPLSTSVAPKTTNPTLPYSQFTPAQQQAQLAVDVKSTAPTAGTAPIDYTGGTGGVAGGKPNQGLFTPTTPQTSFTPNAATAGNQTFVHPGSIEGVTNITDPSSSNELQRFSSALSSYPNDPQQAINIFLQNPANASLKPALEPNGTIGLANGTYLVPPGQGGNANGTTWQVVQRGPETGSAGGGGNLSIDLSGLTGGSGAFGTAGGGPFMDNVRSLLTSQMNGLAGPVDANNPNIAPEIAAYNTQSQRDQQANRDAIAERYYASGGNGGAGLNSGSFNTAVQQGNETAAGQRANFTGSAVFQEAQARRQQLSDLLKTATNYGLTAQAQGLQAQIAAIDAQLREQGLNQQNSQFGDSLGLSYSNLIAQNNRDALLAGLNG